MISSSVHTVNELLRRAAFVPEGVRFLDAEERETTLNWAEILRRAEVAAASLWARKVRPGDRVALILPNAPSFLEAFFGALIAGAVPVPLYPPTRMAQLDEYHRSTARLLQRSRVVAVVTDARTRAVLGPALGAARPPYGLIPVEAFGDDGRRRDWVDVRPADLALIQFSSGTTGDPKPVALEHRHLVAQCAAIDALTRDPNGGSGGPAVSWLPLCHSTGLVAGLLAAAYGARPLVLIPPELFVARPALWLRAISRYKAAVSAAPSLAYALCLKRASDLELQSIDLSTWRRALTGAEPIATETLRRFAKRFAPSGFNPEAFTPVYGLAEAGPAVTFGAGQWPPRTAEVDPDALAIVGAAIPGRMELVSVGTPAPGVSVEVRDAQHQPCPNRRVGRIHVRGPSTMRGYFDDPAGTSGTMHRGFIDTGDVGFVDDGELYVCGRARDVVVLHGGEHVAQHFEAAVERVAGVRAGCAVALGFLPAGAISEELLVLAERRGQPDADDALGAEIRGAVFERTGVRPHTVVLLEPGTLPRTASGGLRRREALRRYTAGELQPPATINPLRLAQAAWRSTVALFRGRAGGAQA